MHHAVGWGAASPVDSIANKDASTACCSFCSAGEGFGGAMTMPPSRGGERLLMNSIRQGSLEEAWRRTGWDALSGGRIEKDWGRTFASQVFTDGDAAYLEDDAADGDTVGM